MVSSQWICAFGKSISYTYHNFIAYDRRTKLLYCGWSYKLLCAQLAKATAFARAAQRFRENKTYHSSRNNQTVVIQKPYQSS